MAETVDINVNINDEEIDKTGAKFVKLQTRIRETKLALQKAVEAGDTAGIAKLRNQLDDLEDQFEKTSIQSKKFGDSLATVPGPAGKVGQGIKALDGAFKFLLANPIVALIAAIGGALLLMTKSLKGTAEGQETLNKMSSAFSKILGPLLAIIEKVALPIFQAFAEYLEFVAEGFSRFAKFLGISSANIKE